MNSSDSNVKTYRLKTKAIADLEGKMDGASGDSVRHRALDTAKQFKSSWLDLGQILYSIWKDKVYRNWGYQKFDAYVTKEVGIRKQTAVKLLRSYFFLEKEEPAYINKEFQENLETSKVPTYESIDTLRLANNNKKIDKQDYIQLRKDVLEQGKDAQAVRKELTTLIKQNEELLPEEDIKKKRTALLRRLVTTLKSLRAEAKAGKVLPDKLIKEADALIEKIESALI